MVWVYAGIGYLCLACFGGAFGYGLWHIYRTTSRYIDEDWWIQKRLESLLPPKTDVKEWLHQAALKRFDLSNIEIHQREQGFLVRLQKTLRRCGPSMSWIRFFLIIAGCSSVWIVILWLTKRAEGTNILLFGTILGVFTAYQWVVFMADRRDQEFLKLFPEVLETMIRTVRAGATIDRSLKIVGEKIREPFGSIFRTMSHQIQVGVPMDHVLKQTADTLMIDDFRFFAVVLSIQQETGGTLAEVLGKLSSLIRARQELRLKMHALTSESRTSAIIVGSLPVGFGVLLQLLSPGHFDPFFQNPTGHMLFNGALGLLGLGFFVLWKMTQIKV